LNTCTKYFASVTTRIMRPFACFAVNALLVGGARMKSRKPDCYSPYDGNPGLTLKVCSNDELQEVLTKAQTCTMLTENFEGMPRDGSCVDLIMICKKQVQSRLEDDYKVTVLEADAGAFLRSASGVARPFIAPEGDEMTADFYSEWRDFDARDAHVSAAVTASGGAAKEEVVGKTLEGRDMKIVRFTGRGYRPGMPKVVFTFNLHAREWIAGMAGVYAVDQLVQMVKSNPSFLDGMEVVMMPMANPDGFIHSQGLARFHRKNMNRNSSLCLGTDLNRNYDFEWNQGGSSGIPCMDNYHGREAGGEPETQVIQALLKESKMTVQIDVHAFSQLILSSWGYTTDDHPRRAEFDDLGWKMHSAVEGKHGFEYTYGPTAQTLYAASGTMTDYATSLGALGYCYELRPAGKFLGIFGFAPPASAILPGAEECWAGLLVSIEYAKSK